MSTFRWSSRAAALGLASVAAAALALTACSSDEDTPSSTSGDGCTGKTATLGQTSPSLLYFPLYVALGSGAFERAGLNIETTDLGGATTVVTALAAGDIDLATVSIGPVVAASREGGRVKAVANLVDNPGLYIVAKADLMRAEGITPNSDFEDKVEFLRGKRIGLVSAGGGTDQLTRFLLNRVGMNPDTDAQLLTHESSSAQVASFVADRVDVVVTSAPVVFTALDEGDGEILWNVPRGELELVNGITNIVLATSTNIAENDPALVECAVEALAESLELIESDFEQALSAAQSYFSEIDPALYRRGAEDMVPAIADSLVITEESFSLALEFLNVEPETSLTDFFQETVDSRAAEAVSRG